MLDLVARDRVVAPHAQQGEPMYTDYAKRVPRWLSAKLSRSFENSSLWRLRSGAIATDQGKPLHWTGRLADSSRYVFGLPFFNRRARRYNVGSADPAVVTALGAHPAWQSDWATLRDGVRLAGAVSPPRDPNAPWIMYFMGNWGDQLAKSQALLETLRGSGDIGLAMWAPRGYEASEGTPDMQAFGSDALELHQRLVDVYAATPAAIHLVGFSMGALIASELAAKLAAESNPAASLSLLSFHPLGFPIYRGSRKWHRHWAVPAWYQPLDRPEQLPDPILVIHAQDDALERVEDTRRFVDTLGGRCRYIELPQGGHMATIAEPALQLAREFMFGIRPTERVSYAAAAE